jgi:hypothetical protein
MPSSFNVESPTQIFHSFEFIRSKWSLDGLQTSCCLETRLARALQRVDVATINLFLAFKMTCENY